MPRIGAEPATREVPVLVFSGDYTLRPERKARQRGAPEYIVKGTIGWETLCDMIGRHITPRAGPCP